MNHSSIGKIPGRELKGRLPRWLAGAATLAAALLVIGALAGAATAQAQTPTATTDPGAPTETPDTSGPTETPDVVAATDTPEAGVAATDTPALPSTGFGPTSDSGNGVGLWTVLAVVVGGAALATGLVALRRRSA